MANSKLKIKMLRAREILDSRGNPTVETRIWLSDNSSVVASVPSGASCGNYEAQELRDGDERRFKGMGVLKAVANVNEIIASKIVGLDPMQWREIDQMLIDMDGTRKKEKLGSNAILSVSTATVKAAARVTMMPVYGFLAQEFGIDLKNAKIPLPILNLINGGKHGAGNLDFQEFHVIPIAGDRFSQTIRVGEEIYKTAEQILIRHGAIHSVGDEGGFAPNLFTNMDALEVLFEAIKEAGYVLGRDVLLGLDVAAGNFYKDGRYKIRDRTMPLSTDELIDYYRELSVQYPLHFLEDPFHADDWFGWKKITQELKKTIITGDDLIASNVDRVKKAAKESACNGVLIKPNQIGTILETFAVIRASREQNWKITVSHRSGETIDDFIADLAVGVGADFVKFGAPARGERVVKYNRLMEIDEYLHFNREQKPVAARF